MRQTRSKTKALAPTKPVTNSHQAFTLVESTDTAPRIEFTDDGDVFLHMCNKAVHPDTGKLAEYNELRTSSEGAIWEQSCAEEMGRLAQGLPPEIPTGRNTIRFISKNEVPRGKRVTYLRVVSTYRPNKEKQHRVRFTVGGNLLEYNGNTSAPTSDLTTYKIMVNSILSTKDAKAVTIDLSDFYLCTNLDEPEYFRIHISVIPQRVIDKYNLLDLVDDAGYVYCEVNGGMYGLKQAGMIANRTLVQRISTAGYYQCKHTPGLFRHNTRKVWFCLVVDDFFAGYVGKENADHLISTLRQDYSATVDWEAKTYCGITMKWDYVNRTCDLSMPGYVEKALQRFEHAPPNSTWGHKISSFATGEGGALRFAWSQLFSCHLFSFS